MARPDFPKSLKEFQARFRDDEACRKYLAACRWPDGFRCGRCGQLEAFELAPRGLWQCKGCGRQTSVTAGSVLHRTRLPLTVWFWVSTDPNPDQDITTVAPGATYYITTSHIWPGNGFVPDSVIGRVGAGNAMSVHVEFITDGKPDLFVVTTSVRVRERIQTQIFPAVFIQGAERARTTRRCDELK